MTAIEQSFEMARGETKRIVAEETINEDTGSQEDISTRQDLVWRLYDYEGAESTLVEKKESGSTEVSVTDETIGAYEIDIVGSDTDSLIIPREHEHYHHRVFLVDSSGEEHLLMKGQITVFG